MRRVTRNTVNCGLVVLSLLLAFQFPKMLREELARSETCSGISLVPPPVEATTIPPLNTSAISLIAYCQRVEGWTLTDTTTAFVDYSDYGNYYEGFVRVWDSVNIGASSIEPGDSFLDIGVRVREDGWILAWLNRFEKDPGTLFWWAHTTHRVGNPPPHSTSLSRAIEIVFIVAGATFPGHDAINLYDYSEPDATRLLILGLSYAGENNYYYTIPANSTMVPIKLLARAGGWRGTVIGLKIDGKLVYEYPPDPDEGS